MLTQHPVHELLRPLRLSRVTPDANRGYVGVERHRPNPEHAVFGNQGVRNDTVLTRTGRQGGEQLLLGFERRP